MGVEPTSISLTNCRSTVELQSLESGLILTVLTGNESTDTNVSVNRFLARESPLVGSTTTNTHTVSNFCVAVNIFQLV